jgi:hypothetical protein
MPRFKLKKAGEGTGAPGRSIFYLVETAGLAGESVVLLAILKNGRFRKDHE